MDGSSVASELLQGAIDCRASDIHLDPSANGYTQRLRIDGLLGQPTPLSRDDGRALVTRLMVMAQLLTYRPDQPQEGRLVHGSAHGDLECRVAVMPTSHGLRAAVRLPSEFRRLPSLEALSLPSPAVQGLLDFATADSGILLLCGPAGAGKTTTIYAPSHTVIRAGQFGPLVCRRQPDFTHAWLECSKLARQWIAFCCQCRRRVAGRRGWQDAANLHLADAGSRSRAMNQRRPGFTMIIALATMA